MVSSFEFHRKEHGSLNAVVVAWSVPKFHGSALAQDIKNLTKILTSKFT